MIPNEWVFGEEMNMRTIASLLWLAASALDNSHPSAVRKNLTTETRTEKACRIKRWVEDYDRAFLKGNGIKAS
jgi:hypothetical protein